MCKQYTRSSIPSQCWCSLCSDLKGRDDFIPLLVDGDGVTGVPLRVDDGVSSLPTDDDGLLAPRRAVQLLGLTLPRHGGVGVAGDHGRDWGEMQAHVSVTNRRIRNNDTAGCGK